MHRGRDARRTCMFVTELTSHESSGWLKAAAYANISCAHAARGFGSTEARGATERSVMQRRAALMTRRSAARPQGVMRIADVARDAPTCS